VVWLAVQAEAPAVSGDLLGPIISTGMVGVMLVLFLADQVVTGRSHRNALATKDAALTAVEVAHDKAIEAKNAEIARLIIERDREREDRRALEEISRKEVVPALVAVTGTADRMLDFIGGQHERARR
jgi:hypothetical protein